jgi:Sulfotransferase domain
MVAGGADEAERTERPDATRPLTPRRAADRALHSRAARTLTAALRRGSGARVKVHGPLRSGTNYVNRLLELNLAVRPYGDDQAGWKHGPIERDPATAFVVVVRDPRTWVVSFHRWEQIHHRTGATSVEEFLQGPVTHERFRTAWGALTPVDAWNRAVRSWLADVERFENVTLLRYEDVRSDLDRSLRDLAAPFGWSARRDPFSDLEGRADDWSTPGPRPDLDRAAAVDGANALSAAAAELVDRQADPALLVRLGYGG